MKEIDVHEIAKNNPQVDTEELQRGQELSRRLKEAGLKKLDTVLQLLTSGEELP